MKLKEAWTAATCFALRLTPTELMTAVMVVPMFWPMMMGMAAP